MENRVDPDKILDLTSLDHLSNDIIVNVVQKRFQRQQIYTYVGDIILAVNPCRELNIYDQQFHHKYRDLCSRSDADPHVFGIAETAHRNLCNTGEKQCIVVSGESGSGKTESIKYVLKHLISRSDCVIQGLVEKLEKINPLVELFGNAVTTLNANSSRFGKLIELFYSSDRKLLGGRLETFVLEKSRVVTHGYNEKNFHIFYALFAGMDEQELRQYYMLENPSAYRILQPNLTSDIHSPTKSRNYHERSAFKDADERLKYKQQFQKGEQIFRYLKYTNEETHALREILSAILHLGNIEFCTNDVTDDIDVVDESYLLNVIQMLKLEEEVTTEFRSSLLTSVIFVRQEKVHRRKTIHQAEEERDALAKELYSVLFSTIITRVTESIKPASRTDSSIGLLDISGFENFADTSKNRFEQLLINITNERLHQYFQRQIFKVEEEDYLREGLNFQNVQYLYKGNQDVLDLIFGSPGVLSILEEEMVVPEASDITLVNKFDKFLSQPNIYSKIDGKLHFGIEHFAGKVVYNADGFLEKNKGKVSAVLLDCVRKSPNPILSHSVDLANSVRSVRAISSKSRSIHNSVVKQYKKSLNSLNDILTKAKPLFIRCIKPNKHLHEGVFDIPYASNQLLSTGILEVSKIRRDGFPVRLKFEHFVNRYRNHLREFGIMPSYAINNCKDVLGLTTLREDQDFMFGKSKIFMKCNGLDSVDSTVYMKIREMQQKREEERKARERKLEEKKKRRLSTTSNTSRRSTNSKISLDVRTDTEGDTSGGFRTPRRKSSSDKHDITSESSMSRPPPYDSVVDEVKLPLFDIFRTTEREESGCDNSERVFLRLSRVGLYILLFCIILVCGVGCLTGLLALASELRIQDDGVQTKIKTELVMIFCIPMAVQLLISLMKTCFGNIGKINLYMLILVFFYENAHVAGTAILLFKVLPRVDSIWGTVFLTGSALIPSLMNFAREFVLAKRLHRKLYLRMAALISSFLSLSIQCFTYVAICYNDIFEDEKSFTLTTWDDYLYFTVSTLCVSSQWVECFIVSDNMGLPFLRWRKQIRRTREKLNIPLIVSKCLVFFCLSGVLTSSFSLSLHLYDKKNFEFKYIDFIQNVLPLTDYNVDTTACFRSHYNIVDPTPVPTVIESALSENCSTDIAALLATYFLNKKSSETFNIISFPLNESVSSENSTIDISTILVSYFLNKMSETFNITSFPVNVSVISEHSTTDIATILASSFLNTVSSKMLNMSSTQVNMSALSDIYTADIARILTSYFLNKVSSQTFNVSSIPVNISVSTECYTTDVAQTLASYFLNQASSQMLNICPIPRHVSEISTTTAPTSASFFSNNMKSVMLNMSSTVKCELPRYGDSGRVTLENKSFNLFEQTCGVTNTSTVQLALASADEYLSFSRYCKYAVGSIYENYSLVTLLCIIPLVLVYSACVACRLHMQRVSFSLPLVLVPMAALGLVIGICDEDAMYFEGSLTCNSGQVTEDNFKTELLSLGGCLCFTLITWHTWWPSIEVMAKAEKMFVLPLLDGLFTPISLLFRRRFDKLEGLLDRRSKYHLNKKERKKTKERPIVYVCATMWHETKQEMTQLLKSLFRLDYFHSQCQLAEREFGVSVDYFNVEVHVIFDDAFTEDEDSKRRVPNQWVNQLVDCIDEAATSVARGNIEWDKQPNKTCTPYGGRLSWTMPGGTNMVFHLKDKTKIRNRKRWSQVMYMYYLLGYKFTEKRSKEELNAHNHRHRRRGKSSLLNHFDHRTFEKASNTFILTLDGDTDFKPESVRLLLDKMIKNDKVGAVCGRIHPVGAGPMIWYQRFEYSVGHWLQKAAEHVFGCILCCPGCFSLFRGSALMDDNVMKMYTTPPSEAKHYIQFEQGEDRWLCTLLLQQGWKIEYCAGADAFTFSPETFKDFFVQRRRWAPSTLANIIDLVSSWSITVKTNDNISSLFMFYQFILLSSSLLGPALVTLMIAGSYTAVFRIHEWYGLLLAIAPVVVYIGICIKARNETQILVAGLLSSLYSVVMVIVTVGTLLNALSEPIYSPIVILPISLAFVFLTAGLMHPKEILNLVFGILYYLTVPSTFVFLTIYYLCNLHIVSWGTREGYSSNNQTDDQMGKKKKTQKTGVLGKWMNKLGLSKIGKEIKLLLRRSMKGDVDKDTGTEDTIKIKFEESPEVSKILPVQVLPFPENESFPLPMPAEQEKIESVSAWSSSGFLGDKIPKETDIQESAFWKYIIPKYLTPMAHNEKDKEKIRVELVSLRNNVVFGFFLLNLLFTILVFQLQINKESLRNFFFLGEYEPVSLVFLFIFAVIVLIQYIGMIMHRWGTYQHLIASMNLGICGKHASDESYSQLALKEVGKLQSANSDIVRDADNANASMTSDTTFDPNYPPEDYYTDDDTPDYDTDSPDYSDEEFDTLQENAYFRNFQQRFNTRRLMFSHDQNRRTGRPLHLDGSRISTQDLYYRTIRDRGVMNSYGRHNQNMYGVHHV